MASSGADRLPSGSLRTSKLFRSGFSSSYNREACRPLPPGHWILDVHGNCSKCHHHHGSARVQVNISRSDGDNITHVRCQKCHEKWLAFGCRNQTQLSLLSINSIPPDPVTVSVQHSLAGMVRLATPIAALSPNLAHMTDLPSSPGPSHQQFFRAASLSSAHDELARSQSMDRRFSNVRDSLGSRFPVLHRVNRRLSNLRQLRTAVNHLEQQPFRTDLPRESSSITTHVPEAATQEEYSQEEPSQEQLGQLPESFPRRSTSSDTATQFLAALANDTTNLGALSDKEKATWVREKYTQFKNENARTRSQHVTAPVDTSVDTSIGTDLILQYVGDLPRSQHQDFAGIGSHQGHFDGFYPSAPSILSISTGTSEAETLLGDTNSVVVRPDTTSTTNTSPRASQAETLVSETNTIIVPSSPRFSLAELVRGERSGSPRPPSINAQTLHGLRRSREIRY